MLSFINNSFEFSRHIIKPVLKWRKSLIRRLPFLYIIYSNLYLKLKFVFIIKIRNLFQALRLCKFIFCLSLIVDLIVLSILCYSYMWLLDYVELYLLLLTRGGLELKQIKLCSFFFILIVISCFREFNCSFVCFFYKLQCDTIAIFRKITCFVHLFVVLNGEFCFWKISLAKRASDHEGSITRVSL